jgi:hypothetical protein
VKILAERTFTLADQGSFAALSGDFNPMHVDEVAARRTVLGAPVVHGVHLVCWALENWLGDGRTATALECLRASFKTGVLVGETVRVVVMDDDQEFTLGIQCGESEVSSIGGKLGAPVVYPEMLPPLDRTSCREMNPADVPQAMGSLPLSYCAADAGRLFPRLSAALPAFQLAALLATTRLVGMECPGLHSLYSEMDLSFSREASGPPRLNYRVVQARFGWFLLEVDGPGFLGELQGFIRPAPSRQAAARELAPLVEKGEFSGQRSVVIGGSRGLGEVVAKLLALGGADVMITYHRGKDDAEAVAAEIQAAGGKCGVAHFDSNRPAPIALPQPPTHIYYFATPHIAYDKTVFFSAERFGEYCRYYAIDFVRTLFEVAQGEPAIDVFYPSTVFLDEPVLHMAEYCAAKAAGEEACRQLARHFPGWRVYAPRLPRMLTDQNNGLMPTEAGTPEIVMLRHLREMKPKPPE